MKIGIYTLTVTKPGFQTSVQERIEATVHGHVRVGVSETTVNAIVPPLANVKTSQFFPDFATSGTFIARARESNYKGLQMNAEHRYSNGFSLPANFTLSKCLCDSRDMLDNGVGSYRPPYVAGMGIRAEVFNLTNTANLGQPGSLNFTTPNTFASISATRDNPNDPREIQLSLKYYF